MGQNLTGQSIASTYGDLVQISGSILTDGLGVDINAITVTASNAVSSSYALTASYALNAGGGGGTIDTGSFMITGSVTSNVLTFTKGDGSTFALTVATGSGGGGGGTTPTGSLLVTASINNATITFTKGDASTFPITVNNVQNANSATFATTAATATNASFATSAGTATTATSASFATTAATATSASFATTATSTTSASFATTAATATSASQATNANTATSASFATTATTAATASLAQNIVPGLSPTFTNVTVTNDLTVNGTASIAVLNYVTGSATYIGDSFIVVNTDLPAQRYAGLAVFDSGSSPQVSASLEWDGQNDVWILKEETGNTSAVLTGPTGSKGAEIFPTANRVQKGGGWNYLVDSNISDNGTTVSINSNLAVTGSYLRLSSGFSGSVIDNITDVYTTSPTIEHVVSLTQVEYNAISASANPNTLYYITDAPGITTPSLQEVTSVGSSTSASISITDGGTFTVDNQTSNATLTVTSDGSNTYNSTLRLGGGGGGGNAFFVEMLPGDIAQLYSDGGLIRLFNNTQVTGSLSATDNSTGAVKIEGTDITLFSIDGNTPQSVRFTDNDFDYSGIKFDLPSFGLEVFTFNNNPIRLSSPTQVTGSLDVNGGAIVYGGAQFTDATTANTIIAGTGNAITINSIDNTTALEYSFTDNNGLDTSGVRFDPATFGLDVFTYNNAPITLSSITRATAKMETTGSVRGEVNALSISSNTASLDLSTGNFFTLTLVSGSNTFINPSNILPGQTINLRITQPSPGFGTVSFPSSVNQVSGSAYVPTAVASAQDIVTLISFDSTDLYLSNVKNLV